MNSDGTVRQFFFTEDELRDIATLKLGKENTVPAFGFAFYSPKERRPVPPQSELRFIYHPELRFNYFSGDSGNSGEYFNSTDTIWATTTTPTFTHISNTCGIKGSSKIFLCSAGNIGVQHTDCIENRLQEREIDAKNFSKQEVSIGAGAQIQQRILPDPYPLDSWKDVPDAVMTVYFVFEDTFQELKAHGMRDLIGNKEGQLQGLPVG
jgi:hypothetical protein